MPVYLPGRGDLVNRASTGQQGPMAPQPMMGQSPVALAQTSADDKVLTHFHSGHPEVHPIALEHSKAHMDAYHPKETKLVSEWMGLADKANEGKALPEHMGRMDAIKMELGQIQQARTGEVQRMNQFLQQRSMNADEQEAGSQAPSSGQRALPQGAGRKVDEDMQNDTGHSQAMSSTGMQTTAQLSTVSGAWGNYSNGLSYQQKSVEQPITAPRPHVQMDSGNYDPDVLGPQPGTRVQQRTPGERLKIGAQSNFAMGTAPGSGNVQAIQAPKAPTQPPAQHMTSAKPAQSVASKSFPAYSGERRTPYDNLQARPFGIQKAESEPQPVTEAVATVAPGEDPETTSGKTLKKAAPDPRTTISGAKWGRQTPIW